MAKILEIIFEAPHVSQKKIGHTTYTTESGKQPDFKMISKQLEKKKQIWKWKIKIEKKTEKKQKNNIFNIKPARLVSNLQL